MVAAGFLTLRHDLLVKICLFTRDINDIAADSLYKFSHTLNAVAKLFVCGGKFGQPNVQRLGVGPEGLSAYDPLCDYLNCFGADVLDLLAEQVYLILHVLLIL